jgi:Cdc6-like AAA superfamily ATPase
MPIIKPLQLEPTSDIEDFAASVFQPKTFSIIYGPEGVGKTALLFKTLHHYYKTNLNDRGIAIGLDSIECYQYHQSKLAAALGVSKIKDKFPLLTLKHCKSPDVFAEIFFHFLPTLASNGYTRFILADGLHHFSKPVNQNRVIKYLIQATDCGIPILATMQTKPDLCYLNEFADVITHTFQLERPEFLGGDILEFGDTRLTME